jgi:lipopolysaccharide transport system permease protein
MTAGNIRLLWVLIERNVKLRYQQTALRYAWALVSPLAMMIVFTLLFQKVLGVQHSDVPYPLFCFCGLMPWTVFSAGLLQSSNSLLIDARLIRFSTVPRILMPMAGAISPVSEFIASFAVFAAMMLYWGQAWSPAALAVIPLLVMAVMFSCGLGLWLSAINVQYRDIGLLLPFLLYMAMLVSPVAYGTTAVQGSQWEWVYQINPMAGVIDGFRWALLGLPFPGETLWKSGLVVLGVLVSGVVFFRKRQPMFADVV